MNTGNHEYDDVVEEVEPIKKTQILRDELLATKDIDAETYDWYMSKQKENRATREEKNAIEKYNYKLEWKIEKVDEEFLTSWFKKTHVLRNLKLILGHKELNPLVTLDNNYGETIKLNNVKRLEKIKMIKELTNLLGFDLTQLGKNILISKETLTNNIKENIPDCEIFKKYDKSEILFGFRKGKINNIELVESLKPFLGFANTILTNWGLRIYVKRNKTNVRKNGKRTSKVINNYFLNYYKDINKYI